MIFSEGFLRILRPDALCEADATRVLFVAHLD